MPALVVIGRAAIASGEFLPDDVPGTSGRLDVLLRCIRSALLCSHGVRADVTIYLVLGGGPRAPRSLRIDGATVRFIRPDERSLSTLARKVLASRVDETSQGFAEVREGIALSRGGLEAVLADLGSRAPLFVLDEAGADIRESSSVEEPGAVFVLGDHLGFDDASRAVLAQRAARAIGVGPRSLHAEDVIAIVLNELDRRTTKPGG